MMEFKNLLPLLLILFLFCTSCTVSAQVLVSIDCGSSAPTYTDENGIVWTSDEKYIKTGQSYITRTTPIGSPHVMGTLRAFTTRKKNCYTITEASKGSRVLVRASFFYGNYDGKSSPPSFALHFDGNNWTTNVKTDLSYVTYISYEVIYTVRGDDGLSVCVSQTTTGQIPFISALEVRTLESTMYNYVDVNYPLISINRFGYGATSDIRYPDDPYDRFWFVRQPGTGLTSVSSDASFISTSYLDRPPSSVLENAITTLLPTYGIFIRPGFPEDETLVYVNMYFSEVREHPTTQTRAFNVLVNDQPLMSFPVVPPYGRFQEVSVNFTASQSTNLTLMPTIYSTLGPIINALELFVIGSLLTDGTNKKDVQGLASLQDAFNVLQDWSGDPCLPFPYSWDWISCSTDSIPRVTAL